MFLYIWIVMFLVGLAIGSATAYVSSAYSDIMSKHSLKPEDATNVQTAMMVGFMRRLGGSLIAYSVVFGIVDYVTRWALS